MVEILSPSTRAHDQVVKRRRYEECGIPEYWIVDPETSRVAQLVLERDVYRLAGEEAHELRPHCLPDVRVDLDSVWS